MLLKYFYDRALAQASYLIGCTETGEAMVIDPAREIAPYVVAANAEGLRIVRVTETHIHADFVSGARELAVMGAKLYLSVMGEHDWQYGEQYAPTSDPIIGLRDGDTFHIGNVRVEALHTPGHTPEHLTFAFTDTLHADVPMGLLTGDALFVGDVGRPDLLETAGGIPESKEANARLQFQTVQRFKAMPDYLQVLPGHGAGSACGKALGAVPSSTLGYEKLFNPAFAFTDENEFVAWLLDGQPETPRYFARMKMVNQAGAPLLADLPQPTRLDDFILTTLLADGALVIDSREAEAFDAGHVPGTISIPAGEKFASFAGWFIDYSKPTYFIADAEDTPMLIDQMRAIGVDDLPGYFLPTVVRSNLQTLAEMTVFEAAAAISEGAFILDVRAEDEYREGHIPNAMHIFYGHLEGAVDALPKDTPIIVHCASGVRSHIAASLLQRAGFNNVINMREGFDTWRAGGLPVEQGGSE